MYVCIIESIRTRVPYHTTWTTSEGGDGGRSPLARRALAAVYRGKTSRRIAVVITMRGWLRFLTLTCVCSKSRAKARRDTSTWSELETTPSCTASDIGLRLGMLTSVESAQSTGKGLKLKNCTRLDLSQTPIGVEGALALAYALEDSQPVRAELTHVNLTWSAIGSGNMKLIKALAEAPNLESLDLTGNWLGDESSSRLSRLMRKTSQLKVLRLRWNGITAVGARPIAIAVSACPRLNELDVGGNWLKTLGASRMGRALIGHPNLQRLRLDHNGMDSAGFKEIARMLVNNSVLQHLDVSGNEIGDVGVKALAQVLTPSSVASSGLTHVSLRLNERVTDVGAAEIAAALRTNTQLSNLDLSGNRISDAGATVLVRAATLNTGILVLRLGDNSPERRLGWAHTRLNGSIMRPFQAMLAARVAGLYYTQLPHAQPLHAPRQAKIEPHEQNDPQLAYWREVYPLANPQAPHLIGNARHRQLVYKTAPHSLLGSSCSQQPWRVCRLDAYFGHGLVPPKILRGSMFAPFRMPPGTCMRSLFGWHDTESRAAWETTYPFYAGAPDNTWSEVAHTRDQSGGAWMYRTVQPQGSHILIAAVARSLRPKIDPPLSRAEGQRHLLELRQVTQSAQQSRGGDTAD